MCHFVTASVPAGTDLDAAAKIFEKHRLSLRIIHNPHLALALAKDIYLATNSGPCDCGTPLGSRRPGSTPPAESEVAKLRKKGWGEAKIRRWQEQKAEAGKRTDRQSEAMARTPEAEAWVALISDMLRAVPYFVLLLHSYSGGIQNERINPTREVVARTDLTADKLLSISEDVLYEFRR